jgi:hypothetical protein
LTEGDDTLGGYTAVHGRPPAFEGADGRAYTASVLSDDDPGPDGRYGAALLFLRWSAANAPEVHLETGYLTFGATPAEAEAAVGRLTLLEVKRTLDRLLAARAAEGDG